MRSFSNAWSLRRGVGPVVVSYGLLVLAQACTPPPITLAPATTIAPGTTSLSLSPDTFLGNVACSSQDGAMKSFVATLTDVTDAENPFTLPSSPPTSCAESAYFQYVTVGHVYTADVDGYEQAPDQLVPLCGSATPASGVAPSCHTDKDCGPLFGCTGSCTIATDLDEDYTCLLACGAQADCLAAHAFCQGTSLNDYLACAEACGATRDCLASPADHVAGHVAYPTNCLSDEFATQAPCGSTPVDTMLPTGGQGDVTLRGQVKACTCTYVATEGARQMFDKNSQAAVSPRWQTPPGQPCGEGEPPASVAYTDVPIAPCFPLIDHGGGTPQVTAIQILPAAALGGAGCVLTGFDGGTIPVHGFNVLPVAPSTLAPQTLPACDSPPDAGNPLDRAVYTDVVPSRTYQFTLQAFGEAAQVVASSTCFATPVAGFTVTAMCDPLIPTP